VEQARKRTAHLGDKVSYLCTSVTDPTLPAGPYGAVHVGGVLLFLADGDVRELSERIERWLEPEGQLILRESVSVTGLTQTTPPRPEGEYVATYRTPEHLLSLLPAFELVDSRLTFPYSLALAAARDLGLGSLRPAMDLALRLQHALDPWLRRSKRLERFKLNQVRKNRGGFTQYFFVLRRRA
jgi:hypothetical protein